MSHITPIRFFKRHGINDNEGFNDSMRARQYLLSNKIQIVNRINRIDDKIARLKTKRSSMQRLLAKINLQLDQLELSEIIYFVSDSDSDSDSSDTENVAEVVQVDVDKTNESAQA
jgi:hypothetical protein